MSVVVNETDIASLQCKVKGNPAPQVTWLKQNSSISLDKRIVQSRGGLMIRDVTSQDGGVYTCRARNILGVMISSATLTVQGNLLPNINVPVAFIRCQTSKTTKYCLNSKISLLCLTAFSRQFYVQRCPLRR